ncbi:MAG: hypothetical protein FJ272_16945, partial [Planctomycetes bacterium]|nr:hypothetical protein [Planctomycetota bacterium]
MRETAMSNLSLEERIRGCLIGAAVGAKLGHARLNEPARFAAKSPEDIIAVKLTPSATARPHELAITDAGVRAYLEAGGRATPEHFGKVFRDHDGIAFPDQTWDGLHTVQEILKEGMNPRISGLGACWSGLLCAAMPAVGIYHFAHPDYAYLDGVELASVGQPRLGADWAGVCAAAIAAAFVPGVTGHDVADTVLRIAFEHNRKLFYELCPTRQALRPPHTDAQFLAEWFQRRNEPRLNKDTIWMAYNPPWFVLPAVRRYANDPRKLMALLVVPCDYRRVTPVSAAIGGAIVGAMHGPQGFPPEWLEWAQPLAQPWFKLAEIVQSRVKQERAVVAVTEQLAKADAVGNSLLKDKVRGCLLAGAIGNAMGSPVEGRSYQQIDKEHPNGITTVLDPSRLEGEDDNQMAMLLVETYLRADGRPVMARDFGRTWVERLNRIHFYPFCMGHAYELICGGADARTVGHWTIVTGSTVMCMEPVGIYHIADPEFAAADATAISYMYQRGLDMVAATILAAAVAEAFRPDATVESVCRAALAVAPTEPLRTFDKRPFESCRHYLEACLAVAERYSDVLAVRKELYARCLLYHMIDPLEVLGFSLAMFKVAQGDVR